VKECGVVLDNGSTPAWSSFLVNHIRYLFAVRLVALLKHFAGKSQNFLLGICHLSHLALL